MTITKQFKVLKLCATDIDGGLAKILRCTRVIQDVHTGLASQVENWQSRNDFCLSRLMAGIVGIDCT